MYFQQCRTKPQITLHYVYTCNCTDIEHKLPSSAHLAFSPAVHLTGNLLMSYEALCFQVYLSGK